MSDLKPFNIGPDDGSWRTPAFRQNVVAKIDESIQRSGMPTSRNSIEMENHVFQKAKTKEEYLSMVARLILHVRDINTKKGGMGGGPGTPQGIAGLTGGPGNSQANLGPGNQVGAGGPGGNAGGQGMAPDPINALQNLASQGSRNNQMMGNMGPQGQMQVNQANMGPGSQMGGMQNQMGPQGPMGQQGPQQNSPITATNLLQTLNQRPQLNMQQLQNKMGMVPNQGPMGPNNMGQGPMVNQMMGGGMQGQMNNPNQMGLGGMNAQMGGQMNPNMVGPNQMGNMTSSQMSMMQQHMQQQRNKDGPVGMLGSGGPGMGQGGPGMGQGGPGMVQGGPGMGQGGPGMGQGGPGMGQGGSGMGQGGPGMSQGGPGMGQVGPGMGQGAPGMGQGGPRAGAPSQFLRQSPSPSAQPSPAPMGGPSPASMGVMGGPMPSPMSVGSGGMGMGGGAGGVASPALAPSPSPHHPSQQHSQQNMQQQQRSLGMAPSPSSSLNTPLGAGTGAAPSPGGGGEDHAYREKVRQLSKYIEPLRRMISRMVSEGENVDKLTKMKKFLDILSHPLKRMPLETLLKCEVVLEKLDFKRGEGMSLHSQTNPLHLQGLKEHQIFNPLLEVVNNSLQSPVANHTLKRTFGPCVEALCGPEIRHMPPLLKKLKVEEPNPDIPDILQGEIARLDSRFKVSLEGLQVGTGGGGIRLVAQLEDARLPCVPPVCVCVPREYPSCSPSCLPPAAPYAATPFLRRVHAALVARLRALPRRHSLSQLLDTWEMSVRQACNPNVPQEAHTPTTLLLGI